MINKLIVIPIIVLICSACGVAFFGQRATLIALEPLQISQTIDGQSSIATVAAETRLAVMRCIDTKSLIIPEVKLSDQKIGYAVFGKFKMEYASVLSFSSPAPVSFSCT